MGGEIEMKWMNNIKIVAANFGDELGGDEGERGNFTGGQKMAHLIGDESSWNRKANFYLFFYFFSWAVQLNGSRHVTLSVCQSKCGAKGLIIHLNLVKSVYVGVFSGYLYEL